MTTGKAKRKRAARSGVAVVEAAQKAQRSQPMIVLASNCNVKDAAELKQTLCLHLDDAEPVTVDVASVERVDTSTMQVLCAFVRDRSAQERKVEWLGDASVVRDAARLLGVESMLCLPAAEVTQ
ncbi:MAG TPA: STAS domain-containing protein [Steroidobacteraceae bacterium]|nr:STAS domain-containing protein [Steroidobacteraceae bacterium]